MKKTESNFTNKTKQFCDDQIGSVTCFVKDGLAWLKAGEIVSALALENVSMALRRVDDEDKKIVNTVTAGGVQGTIFVSEYGMWELVLASRKPQARAFKRWMTHVVLPALRKNGGYIDGEENLSESSRESIDENVASLKAEIERLTVAAKHAQNEAEVARRFADVLREENRSLSDENERIQEQLDDERSDREEREDYMSGCEASDYIALFFERGND